MFKLSLIIAFTILAVYGLRRNFRRAIYVFRTDDTNPDWKSMQETWFGFKKKD